MNFKEKSKWLYSAGKALVSRNLFVTLVVIVIMLQAIIWLAVRSLEDTLLFYRCGSRDYPCNVVIQPSRSFDPVQRLSEKQTRDRDGNARQYGERNAGVQRLPGHRD